MNNYLLVYSEYSESFLCCIAYQNTCSDTVIAHIWEHLVLETRFNNDNNLRDYIKELGGYVHAETTPFLTSFFIKIPYPQGNYFNIRQFLFTVDKILRFPTMGKKIEQVIKEIYLEEKIRQDSPMNFALNQLRGTVYNNLTSADQSLNTIITHLNSFAQTMSKQIFFISLATNICENDIKGIFECVVNEDNNIGGKILCANILNNVNYSTKFIHYCTSLHYQAIILLPQRIHKILLPFLSYVVFGYFSPFIKHLQENRYIYKYINGINYANPIGIEFVTAVFPKDCCVVTNQWNEFKYNIKHYLSIKQLRMMIACFLQSINLEWHDIEKKIKWLPESYAYYKKLITPNTFSVLLAKSSIIKDIPSIIEKCPYHMLSLGAQYEKNQRSLREP